MDKPPEMQGDSLDLDGDSAPTAPSYTLREEAARPRGPLRHDRSLPLPFRVKSGQIRDDVLVLETSSEVVEVPWADIRMVALGMILERVEQAASAYESTLIFGSMEKMMGGVGRMVKGGGGRDDSKITGMREIHLIDLYVAGRQEPFRLDSAHVNYKAFLGQISYVSFQNFFRLVHALASHARSARFNEPLVHFLARRRDRLHRFHAVYDFEVDIQNKMNALDQQPGWDSLSLERNTWAEEWVEE